MDPFSRDGLERLKARRRAVILAHSYQTPEIQDIADLVGDSLELSRAAASIDCDTVVLCGVRFMAETAAVLSPGKVVLNPAPGAGCPLADSMDVTSLRSLQAEHPGASTVVYVNSSLEAKAASWACCTSANAAAVVSAAPSREVVFGPDRNLGTFVARSTGRKLWIFDGSCPPHDKADISDIERWKRAWPDARLLVHPETPPAAWDLADAVLGTGAMISYVRDSDARRFLIGTESGMIHRLEVLFPGREFSAVGRIGCPNMKKTSPEAVFTCLGNMEPVVRIDRSLADAARAAIERMAAIG